eukprot:scaffold95513_cov35-Attheya_sp.AAC.1
MIAVAKSNGNCRKIAEDRKAFITMTLVSMVSSPGKKASKHELDGIQSILGCSRNTAQRTRHRVGAKRAHLQAVQDDKTVKWLLNRAFNIRESPIVRNTLLIDEDGNGVKTRVPKLLLECSVRELHNELISPVSEGGLEEAKDRVTGE